MKFDAFDWDDEAELVIDTDRDIAEAIEKAEEKLDSDILSDEEMIDELQEAGLLEETFDAEDDEDLMYNEDEDDAIDIAEVDAMDYAESFDADEEEDMEEDEVIDTVIDADPQADVSELDDPEDLR